MMSRFPSTATRYMDRNSPKRTCCISGSLERPRRRNPDTDVWFSPCMTLVVFLERQVKVQKHPPVTQVVMTNEYPSLPSIFPNITMAHIAKKYLILILNSHKFQNLQVYIVLTPIS
jgi:hypothetical protein